MNSETNYIHREVSGDGCRLYIDFLDVGSISLTHSQAIALLEVLQEQLPKMVLSHEKR